MHVKHANMLVKKQLQLIKYYRPTQHCGERCYRKTSEGNSSVGIAYRGFEKGKKIMKPGSREGRVRERGQVPSPLKFGKLA